MSPGLMGRAWATPPPPPPPPPPPSSATWNPADKASGIALSNGNLSATGNGSSVYKNVRATTFKGAGKWYFEWTKTGGINAAIGVADASQSFDTQLSYSASASAGTWDYGEIRANAVSIGAPGWVVGDVIGVSIDCNARLLWLARNGTSLHGGNPATGTGGLDVSGLAGAVYPMFGTHSVSGDGAGTVNFGTSAFAYPVPAGFSAWAA